MEDDFVAMEKRVCPVCTKVHSDRDAGILIHKKLRPIPKDKTITGWSMCGECHKKKEDGFIALVGIDPEKSERAGGKIRSMSGAYRTGEIIHIKRHVFDDIINLDGVDLGGFNPREAGYIMVDPDVVSAIKEMIEEAQT